MTDVTIRLEVTKDHAVVEALQLAAFDGDTALTELIRDLRTVEATLPTISLVACQGGAVVGHVMISQAWLDGPERLIDVMVLSPLGVVPTHQRQGIGTALIAAAVEAADAQGVPFLMLEGNHHYYGSRGFEAGEPLGIRRPSLRIPERAFQITKLSSYNPAMTGTLVYKDVHWRNGVGLYR